MSTEHEARGAGAQGALTGSPHEPERSAGRDPEASPDPRDEAPALERNTGGDPKASPGDRAPALERNAGGDPKASPGPRDRAPALERNAGGDPEASPDPRDEAPALHRSGEDRGSIDGAHSEDAESPGLLRILFRLALPAALFALTVLSTIAVGGPAFSVTLLSILVAHEMGHYLVARYHRVPASLPHFNPFPFSFIGTFGAVIGMRTDQATKNQLMDIGAAGPICGFIAAIPAMIIGIKLSTPIEIPPGATNLILGDSLLSWAMTKVLAPDLPPGWDLLAHPVMMAAWAGFLVTAINLLPIGQLDGGHVLYAIMPERAGTWMRRFHRTLLALGLIGLLVQGPSILWELFGKDSVSLDLLNLTRPFFRFFTPGFIVLALLTRFIGVKHPPVREESKPLTPIRRATAFVCLAIWIATFMPNPAWQDAPWLAKDEPAKSAEAK